MALVTLLTGAGASKPLGLKTMDDLLPRGYESRYGDDLRGGVFQMAAHWARLNEPKGRIDFEYLYTMIDALATVEPSDLHAFPFDWSDTGWGFELNTPGTKYRPIPLDAVRKEATSLLEDLKGIVHDELIVPRDKAAESLLLYDSLFDVLSAHHADDVLSMFTTNYDRALEIIEEADLASSLGYGIIRGFHRTARGLEFDPSVYEKPFSERATLRLFKLHGSLNWVRRNDVILESPTNHYLGTNVARGRSAVIYPLRKQAIEEEPFRTCFNFFRETLKTVDVLVAIGTSFRDEDIHEIVQDALRESNLRLVILDPKAAELARLFEKQPSPPSHPVQALPSHFGTEEALESLDQTLKRVT